jgi:hypothetical protein
MFVRIEAGQRSMEVNGDGDCDIDIHGLAVKLTGDAYTKKIIYTREP